MKFSTFIILLDSAVIALVLGIAYLKGWPITTSFSSAFLAAAFVNILGMTLTPTGMFDNFK